MGLDKWNVYQRKKNHIEIAHIPLIFKTFSNTRENRRKKYLKSP